MTLDHLNQAIQDCNNGQVTFNTGTVRSFLYDNKWYPLRAVVNRAADIANEPSNLTTDQCLVQMTNLEMWTRIRKTNFNNTLPVIISQVEVNQEIKNLAQRIMTMTT